MFTQFRIRYPQGSLITELVTIDHGKYVVRTLVQADGITLATGFAAADNLEQAEDRARNRALAILNLNGTGNSETSTVTELAHPATQKPEVAPVVTASNRPSASEKPELTLAEQDSSGDGLTPVLSEITTTETSPAVSPPQPQPKQKQKQKTTGAKATQSKPLSEETTSVTTPPATEELTEKATPVPKATQSKPLPEETTPVAPPTATEPLTVPEEVVEVPEVKAPPAIPTTGPIDFSDIIAKSNVEMKRLGWTNQQGREYLLQTYGKRSRQLLSDEELLEFLQYLESQPTPGT